MLRKSHLSEQRYIEYRDELRDLLEKLTSWRSCEPDLIANLRKEHSLIKEPKYADPSN